MADIVNRDRNIVSFLCTRVIKGKIIFFSATHATSLDSIAISVFVDKYQEANPKNNNQMMRLIRLVNVNLHLSRETLNTL